MDKRFLKEEGTEIFTGNELLLKGALEAGTALITGYPGSPISDVFESVASISEFLDQRGVVAQMANNEGLAAARLNGARIAGVRGLALMKSVGMHVAADGLAIGNLAETKNTEGGALVVVGDDPWNETTQINSDSRFLSQHLHMPVLEPSTFQELKDWMKDAFELSGLSDLYFTYIVTTNQADGGAVVRCRPNLTSAVNRRQKATLSSSAMNIQNLVMIPPHTSLREATLAARRERLLAGVREKGLNRIMPAKSAAVKTGFASAGLSYCYLSQALRDMGLEGACPVLKWGMTYPLDEKTLLDFARGLDHIYVAEEKRGFIEDQMVTILQRAVQEGRLPKMPAVWGKRFPDEQEGFPAVRGMNSSLIVEKLFPLLEKKLLPASPELVARARAVLESIQATAQRDVKIPLRTPTFCPGCPHRDSAVVAKTVKDNFKDAGYMRREHGREPLDVIFHGESGCHSMLQFEPNIGLMQDYSGMGLGGGTGAGVDPFITNKQVVFLGDSTFFHSGMIALSDSLKNHQDITYVILDNKTTAMTGHQPTPGSPLNIMREATFAQDIEHLIRGLSKDTVPIFRVNPAYRVSYQDMIEDVVLKDGVKVIIADKECGITYQRRVRREKKKVLKEQGFIAEERVINITPEVCEYCLECTNDTGCPGLTVEDTLHGPKVVTDLSLCVADGACTQGNVCPSFEEVIVRRQRPLPPRPEPKMEEMPAVAPRSFDDEWYCYTAGVGGMGSGVVTGILVQAGILQGYQVLFADKKGLAIRNGGVYGHVVFSKTEKVLSPLVPYGRADLLLGLDMLEASRGLDPRFNLRVADPARTVALLNTHKMPTIRTLMGLDEYHTSALLEYFKKYTREKELLSMDFSRISEEHFGHKLYGNVLMLGTAFQRGLLPLSWENIQRAVEMIVPAHEREENVKALCLGRQVAATPQAYEKFAPRLPGYWEVLNDRAGLLERASLLGKRLARDYRKMVEEAVRWIDLEEGARARLAQYVYDLIKFEDTVYARRYLSRLWSVHKKDRQDKGFSATRAAMDNLYKSMIIKDEVYVAGLYVSEEKIRRDRERYHVDPRRGDRLEYVHLNRPEIVLGGRTFRFKVRGRNWQMHIVKRLGFLRRWLPDWHAPEKAFRSWYEGVVDGFNYFADDTVYEQYVLALRAPEPARGYREIRYPKMADAQKVAQGILSKILPERTQGLVQEKARRPDKN